MDIYDIYSILFYIICVWIVLAVDFLPAIILRKVFAKKHVSELAQWAWSVVIALSAFTLSLVIWVVAIVPYIDVTEIKYNYYMWYYSDWGRVSCATILQHALFTLSAISFLWIKAIAFGAPKSNNS